MRKKNINKDKLKKAKRIFKDKIIALYKYMKNNEDSDTFENNYQKILNEFKSKCEEENIDAEYCYEIILERYNTVRNRNKIINDVTVTWMATAITTVCSPIVNQEVFKDISSIPNMIRAFLCALAIVTLIMIGLFLCSSVFVVPWIVFSDSKKDEKYTNTEITILAKELTIERIVTENYRDKKDIIIGYLKSGIISIVISVILLLLSFKFM